MRLGASPLSAYPALLMRQRSTNTNFFAWFSDEERHVCSFCDAKACVLNETASFCLACDAITIDGVRVDEPAQRSLAS